MIEMLSTLGPALSEAQIGALEESLGYRLPDDHRQFLLQHNGGEPKNTFFTISSPTDGDTMVAFYGICDEPMDDLLTMYTTSQGRMPANLLPIGWDSFGNQLCLSLSGEDRGKIYFWDHELEYLDGTAPDYHNLTLLAESFTDFLTSLRYDEDSDGA